jgi:hypothetical protein
MDDSLMDSAFEMDAGNSSDFMPDVIQPVNHLDAFFGQ